MVKIGWGGGGGEGREGGEEGGEEGGGEEGGEEGGGEGGTVNTLFVCFYSAVAFGLNSMAQKCTGLALKLN